MSILGETAFTLAPTRPVSATTADVAAFYEAARERAVDRLTARALSGRVDERSALAEVMTVDLGVEDVVVCTEHLRFVPCRRCIPGSATSSSAPDDVHRVRVHQQGLAPDEA